MDRSTALLRRCLASLLLVCCWQIQAIESSMLLGAFDIADPYLTSAKLQTPIVADILPRMISRYDIMAVQGVADDKTAKELLVKVNSYLDDANAYGVAIAQQYAFYYRRTSVSVVGDWTFSDTNGTFRSRPYAVHILPAESDSVGEFLCVVVRTSADPARNLAMLQELPTVIAQAKRYFSSQTGKLVEDVLLMGNLNADCSSLPFQNWQKIPLWTEGSSLYQWLLTRRADTTTSPSTSCAYDRLIAHGQALQKSVDLGSAGVFRFDRAYALEFAEVQQISSHYPVEVRLATSLSLSNPPQQTGNPSLVVQTAPVGVTNQRDVKIWFDFFVSGKPGSSSAASSTLSYLCQYDRASAPSNCSSPWSRSMSEEGPHTLVVSVAGRNLSAGSYSWTVDTKPPEVTNISHSIDGSNHPLVVFECDETECLYECQLHNGLLNPSGAFTPCWGGFRVPEALQQATVVNMSVLAIDRAGNRGQPVQYTVLVNPVIVNTTDPPPTSGPSSNFLEDNLIFVACGCVALGVSMVWIVIILMCRTSSSDDDNKSSSEPQAQRYAARANNDPVQDIALSPIHQLPPPQTTPPVEVHVHIPNTHANTADDVDESGNAANTTSSMKERESGAASPCSPASPARSPTIVAGVAAALAKNETTHFHVSVQSSVGRESGDGQSLHGEENSVADLADRLTLSKASLLGGNVSFRVKPRLDCPSRSHRSSRCVCTDRDDQVRQHNDRKRERRRRRQYYSHHQHGLHSRGGGAMTDVEQYHVNNYRPKVISDTAQYMPGQFRLLGEQRSAEKPLQFGNSNSSSGAGYASASQNENGGNEGSDGKPKLMDPLQRRKLAKRMMQERRAWSHYFSNPSDGESVCSSMRSAPVLPSGLRLLTLSIDERRDPETQSIMSGVTTCV